MLLLQHQLLLLLLLLLLASSAGRHQQGPWIVNRHHPFGSNTRQEQIHGWNRTIPSFFLISFLCHFINAGVVFVRRVGYLIVLWLLFLLLLLLLFLWLLQICPDGGSKGFEQFFHTQSHVQQGIQCFGRQLIRSFSSTSTKSRRNHSLFR